MLHESIYGGAEAQDLQLWGVPKLGICNCGGAEMAPQKPWGAERFFSGAVGAREKILTNKTDMYGRVLI